VYPSMLGADGKPKPELFLADGLHPSAKCYDLWAKLITPYLE
jgi:lysophospholipase L1-like esterase